MRAKLNLAVAFLEREAAAGAVLVVAAAAALLISNSPLSSLYDRILGTPAGVRIGQLALEKPLLLWINDGLMAVFFFLVGLEIKRELLRGELSTFAQAILPAVAAIGGMAVPALVFIAVTAADPATLRGWAIPAATDIAFAVGVLSLMGDRVPHSLKIFLLALAIFDDLGSLVIIAAFYTENLSWSSLALATGGIVALTLMNMRGVTRPAPYLLTAARHPRRDRPCRGEQIRRQAARRALGSARRHRPVARHRLHHEPVHRHAGLRRSPPCAEVRLGVLSGSLLSACLARAVLAVAPRGPRRPDHRPAATMAGISFASSAWAVMGPMCL
jgi:Na+/H+ antiporter NhaA